VLVRESLVPSDEEITRCIADIQSSA
jgi:hypothetical protein